jgi:hypothetical protein
MANTFQACPACARHIKTDEAACPFCGSATPEGFSTVAKPKGPAPLSRAAILFMSATAVGGVSVATACSSSSSATGVSDAGARDSAAAEDTGGPVAAYGPAPVMDSGQVDTGGPVAAYGPGPVMDSGPEFDGPVAAYGPAPVDSGGGGEG